MTDEIEVFASGKVLFFDPQLPSDSPLAPAGDARLSITTTDSRRLTISTNLNSGPVLVRIAIGVDVAAAASEIEATERVDVPFRGEACDRYGIWSPDTADNVTWVLPGGFDPGWYTATLLVSNLDPADWDRIRPDPDEDDDYQARERYWLLFNRQPEE